MAFDIIAARRDGYSDSDIAAGLATKYGMDYNAAKKDGYSDSEILGGLLSHADVGRAAEQRSTLGEVWSQFKAGTFSDLPRLIGQGMKYVSSPGNPLYEKGKSLAEDAEAIGQLPEMQPSATSDSFVTGNLAKGARMIPQSLAPAVGAGLMLSGAGVPATVAAAGGALLMAAPAGLAQGQDTYEKGLARHGLTEEQAAAMPNDPRVREATRAGRMTGAIEFGAEALGNALAGRFVGVGGTAVKSTLGKLLSGGEQTAAQTALRSFTNPGTVGRFAANALETAAGETLTEMGQGAGEAAVERHYGYDNTTPWQAAKEAIGPTLGMSALLLPFGLPAHASHSVKMRAITSALENPATDPQLRTNAAEIVYNELAPNHPAAAENFAAHAFDAIHGTEETGSEPYGLKLDDNVLSPLTPRALQTETAAPVEPPGVATNDAIRISNPESPPINETGLTSEPPEMKINRLKAEGKPLEAALASTDIAPVVQPEPAPAAAIEENAGPDLEQWARERIKEGHTYLMPQYGESRRDRTARLETEYARAQQPRQTPESLIPQSSGTEPLPVLAIAPDKTAKRPAVNPATDDLITAIAKLGGVAAGEVKAQTGSTIADDVKGLNRYTFKTVGSFAHAVKQTGQPLDRMRESLVELGYLTPESTVNDLLDGIGDAARGVHRYSSLYEPDLEALAARHEEAAQPTPFSFTPSRAAAPVQTIGDLIAQRRGLTSSVTEPAMLTPELQARAEQYAQAAGYDMTGWSDQDKLQFIDEYERWSRDNSHAAAPVETGTPSLPVAVESPAIPAQPAPVPAEQKPFTLSREQVERAFPKQAITQDADGYTVTLKNGAPVKVTTAGDIQFDVAAARSAYGREIGSHEKPVAEFRRLEHGAVINLTERGAGQIDHETFHAAMALALSDKQRQKILNKYGSEEAAAVAYQRLRDSEAPQEIKAHLFIRKIYQMFSSLRGLVDPARQVLTDVASGKVWESEAGNPGAYSPAYSMADIRRTSERIAGQLNRIGNRSTFVTADVKPALKSAAEGLDVAWDGVKSATAPMFRSKEAEEAGRVLIEGIGTMEHGRERFVTALNKATMRANIATTRTARLLDLMQSSITLADKVFNRMPEAERIAFMEAMDTGTPQAAPELQRIADTIKTMFDEKAAAIQALGTGMLENVRENYFPHIWQKPEQAAKEIPARLSKRPLEGTKAFSKARVFDDITEGLAAGYALVSTNPIDLVMLKMTEMDRYINAHRALQAMEESGLVQLIPAGEKMPDGYGDISGRYGLVTKRAHQDPASGEPGELKSYRYVAREDVAQVFNNYLSQNLYTNKYLGKPFTAYMRAANTLNQFQLGVFSAFHAGFTSLEAVISHGALGIKALTRGDYKEAASYFKHAPAAWYLNPKLGDKVLKAWMGDEAAAREMPQIVEWLTMAGARRIMDSRFQTDATQKMLQAWSDGNKIGTGARMIPAIVEQSARPIMEWLVPRQKFGVFAEMANEWYGRHPNATHEETRAAMQRIWNRVDSRLGQVVYDRLFVHNVAKNLTQALIRAPGWTGGTILEVGGGLKDLAGYARDTAKGKRPELSDRAAYTLSLLVTTAVANALLTALFTGEPPKDWKDLLAFRTGKKDEKGNPERFMLPTYAKDVYAYAMQPGATLLHKSHPMLSLVGDLVRNRDYYGVEIRHEGDNPIMQLVQAGKFTAKAFTPFWMKGVAKEIERGGNIVGMAAPLVGIMPAPASMNMTRAERLASELVRARMPQGSKTAEQFERSQLMQHLTGLARRDPRAAAEEIAQAHREGKINRLQAGHIMQNARLTPMQAAFKRLSLDEAMKVWEVATDAEKRQLRRLLFNKRRRAHTVQP